MRHFIAYIVYTAFAIVPRTAVETELVFTPAAYRSSALLGKGGVIVVLTGHMRALSFFLDHLAACCAGLRILQHLRLPNSSQLNKHSKYVRRRILP